MNLRTSGFVCVGMLITNLAPVHAETLKGRDGDVSYALDGVVLTRTRNITPNFSMGGLNGRVTKLGLTITSHEANPIHALKGFKLLSAADDTGHSMLPDAEFVEIGFKTVDETRLYPITDLPGVFVPHSNPHDIRLGFELNYPSTDATSFSLAGQFEYSTDPTAGLLEVPALRDKLNKPLLPEDSEWNFVPIVIGERKKGDATEHVVHIEIMGPYRTGAIGNAQFFDASDQEIRPQMRMAGLYMPDVEAQGPSAVSAYMQWAASQPQELWNKPFDEIFEGTPWEDVARPALQYRFPAPLPEGIRMVMSVPTDAATTTVEFHFDDVVLP